MTLTGEDGPSWTGSRGRISAKRLAEFAPDLGSSPAYLRGPDPMVTEIRKVLVDLGVPEAAIPTEAFVSPSNQEPEPDVSEPEASAAGDRTRGLILACHARATSDVVVESLIRSALAGPHDENALNTPAMPAPSAPDWHRAEANMHFTTDAPAYAALSAENPSRAARERYGHAY